MHVYEGRRALMPFGKHRGKPLASLPSEYIKWLASLSDLSPALTADVQAEVKRRAELETKVTDAEVMERVGQQMKATILAGVQRWFSDMLMQLKSKAGRKLLRVANRRLRRELGL